MRGDNQFWLLSLKEYGTKIRILVEWIYHLSTRIVDFQLTRFCHKLLLKCKSQGITNERCSRAMCVNRSRPYPCLEWQWSLPALPIYRGSNAAALEGCAWVACSWGHIWQVPFRRAAALYRICCNIGSSRSQHQPQVMLIPHSFDIGVSESGLGPLLHKIVFKCRKDLFCLCSVLILSSLPHYQLFDHDCIQEPFVQHNSWKGPFRPPPSKPLLSHCSSLQHEQVGICCPNLSPQNQ